MQGGALTSGRATQWGKTCLVLNRLCRHHVIDEGDHHVLSSNDLFVIVRLDLKAGFAAATATTTATITAYSTTTTAAAAAAAAITTITAYSTSSHVAIATSAPINIDIFALFRVLTRVIRRYRNHAHLFGSALRSRSDG